jgi:hypothetical protein
VNGRIVSLPPVEHTCSPGWGQVTDPDFAAVGERYGVPPTSWEFPPGTVWECDCGAHVGLYRPGRSEHLGQRRVAPRGSSRPVLANPRGAEAGVMRGIDAILADARDK